MNQARPVLLAIEPQVFVSDMGRAVAYYQAALGFAVGFLHGEPPFYGQMARDEVKLNLRLTPRPVLDMTVGEDLLAAAITVCHAGRLFEEFSERAAVFHQSLRRETWHAEGQAAFIVADPDGNLLLFAGPTD